MAKPIFGRPVPILLDKNRNLRFKFDSYAMFHEKTGHSINKFFFDIAEANKDRGDDPPTLGESSRLSDLIGVNQVRDLLYVSLVHEDPGLTPEKVLSIMDEAAGNTIDEKLGYILGKISQVYMASKGIDPDDKKEIPVGESTGRGEVTSSSTGS